MHVNTLCIIGAGTMGTGIAQLAAQAGIRVFLLDSIEAAIPRSQSLLNASLEGGVARGKLTPEQANEVRRLISWELGYERLGETDWVIEAVFEDRAVKGEVLRIADELARPGVPIASNTSSFPIRELSAGLRRPERFLGMHFFNPAPAMKLVEVIPGPATLPEVEQAARALCERMGRAPVVAPDIPGFIVNRLFGALVSAALDLWAQGTAAESIDTCVELGLGHKMGPLRSADLVGLDVMLALLRSLHQQTGHPRFEAPPDLSELVAGGKLGRKSGEGFYRYGEQ